jgi:SOS response regulatory protein OraA/RecX
MTQLITAIEPSGDDPNFRDIYVQGKLAMTLSFSMVETLQLTVQQEWNGETSGAVEQCHALEDARKMAIELISRRTWGCNELKTRLVKRGTDSGIATLAIEQLIDDGWLDDHSFACALIRQWLRKEPAGRRWLMQKLYEKEIARDIAQGAIDEELAESTEQEFADGFALKRLAKTSGDEETVKRKVISALHRKGFASGVAFEAFKHAQNELA